ncbi:MAG TPA: ThuA domain-containing protein [Thermoguttaceae bacterium]|nr:ThuA domain-containing protein [Thermoguttaceae bacterium]
MRLNVLVRRTRLHCVLPTRLGDAAPPNAVRRLCLLAGTTVLTVVAAFGAGALAAEPDPDHVLPLYTRSRAETPDQPGKFQIVYKTIEWDARKTGVIVCDMWARHWCEGACRRGAEMAPRMDQFVSEARRRGALVVHSPSGGMDLYADHAARKRAQEAPKAANLPDGVASWCRQIESETRGEYPLDQSDGGCDDEPPCDTKRPMDRHQTPAIEIRDEDAITDSGVECWNLFEQHGVENVILVGVHTNMCVLGRPFGLRNLVRFGKNVLLVRDLTDTMYNPRMPPQVSHVRGTELIVEHIEKYVCPTITSSDLLGGPALRFAEDDRPHVAFLVSDDHYHADKLLPVFAQMLRDRYGCHSTVLHGQGTSNIAATGELVGENAADCLVLYVRRLALPEEQLDRVRKYLASGKPLVGMRTASHAFDTKGKHEPGQAEWPEFDHEVLGGNYQGHGPNPAGTDVAIVPDQAGHPILAGVEPAKWHSAGSLYFTSPVAENATVLMTGALEDRVEPLTWVRDYQGSRVVYTGLGHPDDFQDPQFRRLLVNTIFWAMDRPVPEVAKPTP